MSDVSAVEDTSPEYSTYNFNTNPDHFLEPIDIAIETIMASRQYDKEVEIRATMQFGSEKPQFDISAKGSVNDRRGNSAELEVTRRNNGITDISVAGKHSDKEKTARSPE